MNTEMPKGLESEQETVFEEIRGEISDLKDGIDENNGKEVDSEKKTVDLGVEDESKLSVHGFIRLSSKQVYPDWYEIGSEYPSILSVVDVSKNLGKDLKVGTYMCYGTDGRNDPENPAGTAAVLNPYLEAKLGKNRNVSVSAGTEFTYLPLSKESKVSTTPWVAGKVGLGSDGALQLQGFFPKGRAVIGATLEKDINKRLGIALKTWYDTFESEQGSRQGPEQGSRQGPEQGSKQGPEQGSKLGHFSGAVDLNINLGNGFGVQLNLIVGKDGKFTQNMGVLYHF